MRALVLATVLGVSATAAAQPVVHKEGEYTGVTPGKPPEAGERRRPAPKGTLSWVGFAAKDGGAEVFFQSATKFEVSQELSGGALIVHLAGLTRQVTNTRRPIDTRFFDNPLARITAQPGKRGKRGKRGVDVRIVFKNPKDARQGTLRTATEADGLFYAYLSFPEGADSAVIPGAAGADPGSGSGLATDLDGADDDDEGDAPVVKPDDGGAAEDDEQPDAKSDVKPKAKARPKAKAKAN